MLAHIIHDGSSRNRAECVPREAYLVSRMRRDHTLIERLQVDLVHLVSLVYPVFLVSLVHLISFVQPKNQTNEIDQKDQINPRTCYL